MKSLHVNWFDHIFNVLSVIIGVSLAFWVNDSAEQNKRADDLRLVINSFLEELESDSLTYVGYQIPDNLQQVKDINSVIGFLAERNTDSLQIKFQNAVGLNNYHPVSNTFNSLTSSGKLDLIEDFSLRQDINNYYTALAKEAEWRGKFQVDFYTNELLPWLMYNMDFVDQDFEKVNKVQLTNLLIVYAGIINNKVSQYETISIEAGKLKRSFEDLKNEQ